MAATVARIELFDRSMSVAAQFFTSVFPILILTATWVGSASDQMAETLDMPKETREVLDSALQDSSTTSFGVIGALIVLISATSLSRALTRAFAEHLAAAPAEVQAQLGMAVGGRRADPGPVPGPDPGHRPVRGRDPPARECGRSW